MSQLRGIDGAGVFQARSKGSNYGYGSYRSNSTAWGEGLYKTEMPFSNLLIDVAHFKGERKEILDNASMDVIMTHVRASTKGIVSKENAHPFEFDNLVGAHNGTLKDAKYNLPQQSKTDSEMMFADISTRGIANVLNELDRESAFAVVIFNKADRNVYFSRNESRPMCFAFLKRRSVMYYASDAHMLEYILDRNDEEYKIFYQRPRVVIRVDPQEIDNKNWENIKRDELRITHVLSLKPPLVWEKIYADKAKAAEKEREARAKAEKHAKVNVKVKDVPKTEIKAPLNHNPPTTVNNVVNFQQGQTPPTKEPTLSFSPKGSYVRCSCGLCTLNFLQADLAMKGIHKSITFDKAQDKFFCDACRGPAPEVKESVERAIG